MKVFVVYAHPNPKSFNHAILDSFIKGLKDAGHSFEVADLYAMNFDSCLTLADFAQFEGKPMPKDVLDQQKKVAAADALVFIFPVWWYDFPAILKGWFDRVFSYGFAYKFTDKGYVGLLNHRKALLISTAGASEADNKASGIESAMDKIMVDSDLKGSGIQNVEHRFFYNIPMPNMGPADSATIRKYLETAYKLGRNF